MLLLILSAGTDANDVDHVTLYQNGIAAISLVRPFQSAGGQQVLTISLPTTTVFESLTVEGVDVAVMEMRSALASDPALHTGDSLIIHMDDGKTHAGTFVSQDGGQILLATQSGTTLVQMSHVSAVEVAGRKVDPNGPASTTVSILVSSPAGTHSVRVAYLARGSGWNPSYILDPGTGAMTFFATLTGMQNWHNVTLDLVSGNPNMVYNYRDSDYSLSGLSFDVAAGSSPPSYTPGVDSSESLGSLHRYHYKGTVELAQGETVRLPMVTGTVDVQRHYFQAGGSAYANEWQSLPELYKIRNTLGESLPAGQVRLFLDGEWIGSDNLRALAKGEVGNVTVSHSDDVKARTVQQSQTRGQPSFPDPLSNRGNTKVTTTYDLQVRNLSDNPIDLRAMFQTNEGGSVRVMNVQPGPDETIGSARIWNHDVPSGATVHYLVTIETVEDSYR